MRELNVLMDFESFVCGTWSNCRLLLLRVAWLTGSATGLTSGLGSVQDGESFCGQVAGKMSAIEIHVERTHLWQEVPLQEVPPRALEQVAWKVMGQVMANFPKLCFGH